VHALLDLPCWLLLDLPCWSAGTCVREPVLGVNFKPQFIFHCRARPLCAATAPAKFQLLFNTRICHSNPPDCFPAMSGVRTSITAAESALYAAVYLPGVGSFASMHLLNDHFRSKFNPLCMLSRKQIILM
jgi:hypothetical protein